MHARCLGNSAILKMQSRSQRARSSGSATGIRTCGIIRLPTTGFLLSSQLRRPEPIRATRSKTISFPESALLCPAERAKGTPWDNPFQLEFSLADHMSMSSRTSSQKVNNHRGKDSGEREIKYFALERQSEV